MYAGPVYTDCERPPTILHGRTELSVDDDGVIVTALYTCETGYQLHGQSQMTCNTDTDEWEGDLPACKLGKTKIKILNGPSEFGDNNDFLGDSNLASLVLIRSLNRNW